MNRKLLLLACVGLVFSVGGVALAQEEDVATRAFGVAECTYKQDPDEFRNRNFTVRTALFNRLALFNKGAGKLKNVVPPGDIPRQNLVDEEIFNTMGTVPSAGLSNDQEFLRRIYYDMTGRQPTPDQVRAFLGNTDPNKRNTLIDELLNSPEFVDRWLVWLGDLVQNAWVQATVNRYAGGRNAFHLYLKDALVNRKSMRDIAIETVSNSGNNFSNGETGFPTGSITPGGPIQDRVDTALRQAAQTWLGLAYYDCVLCHNGNGRLNNLSAYFSGVTRRQAWEMSGFFAHLGLINQGVAPNLSRNVFDCSGPSQQGCPPTFDYRLNTTNGNRPNRAATPLDASNCGGTTTIVEPQYHTYPGFEGGGCAGDVRRTDFANFMVNDPMFGRNLANRVWKQLFGLGLVDPVDTMDPARLDPNNPPPDPWTFQATHPQLLERLGQKFAEQNYDLREFVKFLVQSSAYQLSSRYEGAEWQFEYINLFARHFPRRLEGEEVLDTLAKGSGAIGNYNSDNQLPEGPVSWMIQMPEPVEPRGAGACNNPGVDPCNTQARNFAGAFLRGNRDGIARGQANSLLQQLYLMNDVPVLLNRLRMNFSPELQRVSGIADDNEAVGELFLLFLSRLPDASELSQGVAHLQSGPRNDRIEDLAWVVVNKIDFLFNY